jgi:hypothetical protein
MNVYDNYEISPCKQVLDSDAYPPEESIEVCEEQEAEFWTLYGHIGGEGVHAIGDFRSREAAEQVYARITCQPFTGSYQAAGRLRVMHAGPDLLEICETLARRLPELDDDDAPLAGSEAVQALADVWPDLKAAIVRATAA